MKTYNKLIASMSTLNISNASKTAVPVMNRMYAAQTTNSPISKNGFRSAFKSLSYRKHKKCHVSILEQPIFIDDDKEGLKTPSIGTNLLEHFNGSDEF